MTHRQRVLTALDREEPDRVPIDIGASVNNLNDGVYHEVKRCLGIEGDIRPFRGLMTATYYDECAGSPGCGYPPCLAQRSGRVSGGDR